MHPVAGEGQRADWGGGGGGARTEEAVNDNGEQGRTNRTMLWFDQTGGPVTLTGHQALPATLDRSMFVDQTRTVATRAGDHADPAPADTQRLTNVHRVRLAD